MKSNSKKVAVILVTFFIVVGTIFAFYYNKVAQDMKKPPGLPYWGADDLHKVRDFAFLNQDGDTITLADVKGKILVIEYFFTTCKGICPEMNENLATVYNTFKNEDDVVILSHTVDPKRDSVPVMKAYSRAFDADSKKWMFLTGNKQDLYNQAYYSYNITAADSSASDIEADFIHTENLVLVDKEGRLRAHADKDGKVSLYDGTKKESVAQMIKDIKQLQLEG